MSIVTSKSSELIDRLFSSNSGPESLSSLFHLFSISPSSPPLDSLRYILSLSPFTSSSPPPPLPLLLHLFLSYSTAFSCLSSICFSSPLFYLMFPSFISEDEAKKVLSDIRGITVDKISEIRKKSLLASNMAPITLSRKSRLAAQQGIVFVVNGQVPPFFSFSSSLSSPHPHVA